MDPNVMVLIVLGFIAHCTLVYSLVKMLVLRQSLLLKNDREAKLGEIVRAISAEA